MEKQCEDLIKKFYNHYVDKSFSHHAILHHKLNSYTFFCFYIRHYCICYAKILNQICFMYTLHVLSMYSLCTFKIKNVFICNIYCTYSNTSIDSSLHIQTLRLNKDWGYAKNKTKKTTKKNTMSRLILIADLSRDINSSTLYESQTHHTPVLHPNFYLSIGHKSRPSELPNMDVISKDIVLTVNSPDSSRKNVPMFIII